MFIQGIPNEYQTRVNSVVNFILQNLTEELSLRQLAEIGGYSPFHFQKIFKQVTGESPKQYVIRARLETSAHALIMHAHRTVTEIALANGFSSSATFARAFRSYFGVSAEEFRANPRRENAKRYQKRPAMTKPDPTPAEIAACLASLNIRVQKISARRCVFINARLNDSVSIETAFRRVARIAETHDLIAADSQFAGAVYLHSGIYRSMIGIESDAPVPKRFDMLEIPAAKYAVLDLDAGFTEGLEKLQIFADFWLPESGYRVAEIVGYEMLSESPLEKPYSRIKKEIYIEIEPAL
jgi:AraC family transcriptional regulator